MIKKTLIQKGIRDAFPIITAYFPIAITFGVLSASSGLPNGITFLISAWIFAGGAQFILLSLASTGVSLESMVITVLLVNARHILYGTTLGAALHQWTEKNKWLFAFGMTDEVFAVASSQAKQGLPAPYLFSLMLGAYGSWVTGTLVGIWLGNIFPSSITTILNYAMPALFVGLLFNAVRSKYQAVSAMVGGLLATIGTIDHENSLGLVAGSLIGATIGFVLNKDKK